MGGGGGLAGERTHARTQAPHIVPCRSLALSTDQNWFHTKTTPPSIRSPGKSSVDTRSLRQIYSLVAFNRYATTHTRTTHLCALSERASPCELALLARAHALIKHYNDSVVDACRRYGSSARRPLETIPSSCPAFTALAAAAAATVVPQPPWPPVAVVLPSRDNLLPSFVACAVRAHVQHIAEHATIFAVVAVATTTVNTDGRTRLPPHARTH